MKGNSERVKNKNLKNFSGRPLYHAICLELLKSKYIHKIVINTDSENIKEDISNNFPNIEIINRPDFLLGDFVPMNSIIEYDLQKIDSEYFIQTHSTNPLLKAETIDLGIEKFFEMQSVNDSVFSVTKLQTRLYKKDGSPLNHNPKELLRTQDLEPLFEENSCFYIFSKNSFYNSGNKRIGSKPYLFEISKIEAVDIDEPDDFIVAESLYNYLRKKDRDI
jgi:CMP-N-acetylneuraminic acid synthetase